MRIVGGAVALYAAIACAGDRVQAEIRVGIAGPLSGSSLPVGEQQEIGASAAIAGLNARGGVLGEQIVAISVDDACDAEQAKAAARQLVREEVAFVVGHVCSAASMAVGSIYEEAGIVMISPASTNPTVTDSGHRNVFRVIGRDDQQGFIAGNFIADRYADRRVAIIHDENAYGRGLAEYTKRQLNARGVAEVLFESFAPDQSDYTPLVAKLVAVKPDVLYGGGYQGDLGIIVRQAKQILPNLQVIGGDSLTASEFRFIAGDAAEGTYLTFGSDPRLRPEAAEVVRTIREDYAYDPAGYTLHAYAAVQTWAQAVEEANSLDPDAIIKTLRTKDFETVLGTIGFDEKGDVTGVSTWVWYRWTGDDYVTIE
jgi:branched-chain amino acid transport system substrate-binding protein